MLNPTLDKLLRHGISRARRAEERLTSPLQKKDRVLVRSGERTLPDLCNGHGRMAEGFGY